MKYHIKFIRVIANFGLVIIALLPIVILVLFDVDSLLGSLIYSSLMVPLFIVLARIFPDVFLGKKSEEVFSFRFFYKTSPIRSFFVILFFGAGILTFTWEVLVFPLFNIQLEIPTILLSMGVIFFPVALEVYFLRK